MLLGARAWYISGGFHDVCLLRRLACHTDADRKKLLRLYARKRPDWLPVGASFSPPPPRVKDIAVPDPADRQPRGRSLDAASETFSCSRSRCKTQPILNIESYARRFHEHERQSSRRRERFRCVFFRCCTTVAQLALNSLPMSQAGSVRQSDQMLGRFCANADRALPLLEQAALFSALRSTVMTSKVRKEEHMQTRPIPSVS